MSLGNREEQTRKAIENITANYKTRKEALKARIKEKMDAIIGKDKKSREERKSVYNLYEKKLKDLHNRAKREVSRGFSNISDTIKNIDTARAEAEKNAASVEAGHRAAMMHIREEAAVPAIVPLTPEQEAEQARVQREARKAEYGRAKEQLKLAHEQVKKNIHDVDEEEDEEDEDRSVEGSKSESSEDGDSPRGPPPGAGAIAEKPADIPEDPEKKAEEEKKKAEETEREKKEKEVREQLIREESELINTSIRDLMTQLLGPKNADEIEAKSIEIVRGLNVHDPLSYGLQTAFAAKTNELMSLIEREREQHKAAEKLREEKRQRDEQIEAEKREAELLRTKEQERLEKLKEQQREEERIRLAEILTKQQEEEKARKEAEKLENKRK